MKEKICETCKTIYSKSNFKKWCSEECYNKRKGAFTSGGSIIGNCLLCNERVLKYKSQIVSGNIFCNSKCSGIFNAETIRNKLQKQVKRKCENCNLEISVTQSSLFNRETRLYHKHKFCSRKCNGIYLANQKLGIHDPSNTYTKNRSSLEEFLEEKIRRNLPYLEIDLNNRSLIDGYELDIYIPEIKLAIEVNGICHFKKVYKNQKLEKMQQKDKYKIEKCKKLGIELIVIPFIKRLYLKEFENIWSEIKPQILKLIPFYEFIEEQYFDFKIKGRKQLKASKTLINKTITKKNSTIANS